MKTTRATSSKLIDYGITVREIKETKNITQTLKDMPRHWEYQFSRKSFKKSTLDSIAYQISRRYKHMYSVILEGSKIIVLRQR